MTFAVINTSICQLAGADAYICGEETSLLESLKANGVWSVKTPLPALKGLFGKPTVVNNVLSLLPYPLFCRVCRAHEQCGFDAVEARSPSSYGNI